MRNYPRIVTTCDPAKAEALWDPLLDVSSRNLGVAHVEMSARNTAFQRRQTDDTTRCFRPSSMYLTGFGSTPASVSEAS